MLTHTYCNVESNALKFPVFPLDHLLTSASRTSATLCNKIRFCKTKCETYESQNLIENYISLLLLLLHKPVTHILFCKSMCLHPKQRMNKQFDNLICTRDIWQNQEAYHTFPYSLMPLKPSFTSLSRIAISSIKYISRITNFRKIQFAQNQ